MFERRREKRIRDSVVVMFETKENKILEQEVSCLDLSVGGIQVAAPYKFELGQELNIKLGVFSDVIPLEIQAKVARVEKNTKALKGDEYVVGFEFIHVDSLTQERLNSYIKRRILQIGKPE